MRIGIGDLFDTTAGSSIGIDTSNLVVGSNPTVPYAVLNNALADMPESDVLDQLNSINATPPGFDPCVPTSFVGPLAPGQVLCGSPGTFGAPGTIDASGSTSTAAQPISKYIPWVVGGLAVAFVLSRMGGRRR